MSSSHISAPINRASTQSDVRIETKLSPRRTGGTERPMFRHSKPRFTKADLRRFQQTVAFFILFVIAAAFVAGCDGRCTDGVTQNCACRGGLQGVQTCGANGAFGTCDCGQLTEQDARRLAEGQDVFRDGVTCSVEVTRFAHERYSMPVSHYGCMNELQRAEIISYGAPPPSESWAMEVFAKPPARLSGRHLFFTCGTASLGGIAEISTTGNTATFKYTYDVVVNQPLLASLPTCNTNVASSGRREREITARRDDQGAWSLVGNAR